MVLVFWVLSGVSLSLKPIKLARSQSWDKFLDTLFSSVFRRGLRLYLPVMFVQLCVLTMTLMGMFNHSAKLHKAWPFGGTNEKMFAVKDTNLEQIKDWTWTMWCFCNPFRPIRPLYDVHLWTIPLEFRNSIVLFATLIGFSKLRPCIRIALTITLCAYCVLINENDVALFIAGMGIAEYILIREEADQQLPSTETKADLPGKQSLRIRIYWGATCLIGLHLLSIPAWYNDKSLGYVTLNQITPSFITSTERTFGSMGAAIFVFTLSGCEILRRPFQTPLAIYLGNISFPLYIVHGAINHTLGLWSVEFFFLFTGSTTFVGYEMGVILGFVPVGVTVVFLADLLMRVVDAPSVRFGRTLQNMWSVPVVRPNQRGVNVR
jgi:peptidoglycan/LPS O-acetylase OafA/YrhL